MRALRSTLPWIACAAIAACGNSPPPPSAGPGPGSPPAGSGAHGSEKPQAPIDLTMEAHTVAGTGAVDRYEVVLHATPRRELESVQLSIDGNPSTVAAATAGAIGEARAFVEVAHGDGKDVIGTAVIVVGGQRMGSAAQIRIGAPSADQPAGTVIYLPDGTPVQEVRP